MSTHVEGSLVYWHRGLDTTLGVITELLQGGRQLRVRFDSGDEKIFAAQSGAIRRFRFTPGEPVQVLPGKDTGVVVEEKPVGERLYYTVSLPGNKVKKLAENGLRPAELTDPVERLRTGKAGNPRKFALRTIGARYAFANRYDEFTSLGNSRIEAKPHQISVAHRVTNGYPHRFLLCDEVGLGKTIEAGMVLKELRARKVAKRVLILVPANLLSQWQFELKTKFNESFSIYNGDSVKWLKSDSEAETNVWDLNDSILASHNFAAYSAERIEEIAAVDWDLVIVDEAHHARVRYSGAKESSRTWLYRLVDRLADFQEGGRRSLLLLTATPMQLDQRELYSLVELLDPALFPTVEDFQQQFGTVAELNSLVSAIEHYDEPEEVGKALHRSSTPPGSTVSDPDPLYKELSRRVNKILGATGRSVSDVTGEAPSGNGQAGTSYPSAALASPQGRQEVLEALRRRHRLSEVLIRNRKSKVGGFQPRLAFNWSVEHTDEEREAYAAVEEYVRAGYQRALETQNNALGFVMVAFQKMMASSSRALQRSLQRRHERLSQKTLLPVSNGYDFEESDPADAEWGTLEGVMDFVWR